MTTNHPEKLDEALIRPGRVDHQVGFGNANQIQVKQLFERMYTNDLPRTKLIINNPTPAPPTTNGSILTPPATPITSKIPDGHLNGSAKGGEYGNGSAMLRAADKEIDDLREGELVEITSAFADMVPDDEFSPAEIQGFLLKRKKDPRKALLEVDLWVQGMMEQKKRGTKLLKVQ
jgi:mitochondrial chaperone BCS1